MMVRKSFVRDATLAAVASFVVLWGAHYGGVFDYFQEKSARARDFFFLCDTGTADEIQEQILSGADINKVLKGWTPLAIAVRNNRNPGVVALLLENGAKAQVRIADDWSPLLIAVVKKDLEATKLLIAHGADANSKHDDGRTALMLAAYDQGPEMISYLIESGADVKAKDKDGWTALAFAAEGNPEAEVFELLLRAGADVNVQSQNAMSPLDVAARYNENEKVIALLIEAGAVVDVKNKEGWTPLMRAAYYNKNPKVLRVLIEKSADVNARTEDGWTPLLFAARYNKNPDIVATLLQCGADATAKTEKGSTAVDLAERYSEHSGVLAVLTGKSVDVNPENFNMIEAKDMDIDLVNPDAGLLGFRFCSPEEEMKRHAGRLGLALLDMQTDDNDTREFLYSGRVWGRPAYLRVGMPKNSSGNASLMMLTLVFESSMERDAFEDAEAVYQAVRNALLPLCGEPDELAPLETATNWQQRNPVMMLKLYENKRSVDGTRRTPQVILRTFDYHALN